MPEFDQSNEVKSNKGNEGIPAQPFDNFVLALYALPEVGAQRDTSNTNGKAEGKTAGDKAGEPPPQRRQEAGSPALGEAPDYMEQARTQLKVKTNAELETRVAKEITNLGDEDYRVRASAYETLKQLGPAAVRQIATAHIHATRSSDAEVTRSTRWLLEGATGFNHGNLHQLTAALKDLKEMDYRKRDEMRPKLMAEESHHIGPRDLQRGAAVRTELDMAAKALRKEFGPNAAQPLKGFYDRIDEASSLQAKVKEIGVERILAGRDLAHSDPAGALRQLTLALKDNRQRSINHAVFYFSAATALNVLQRSDPKATESWLKHAKSQGVDMKYLEEKAGFRPRK